VEEKKDIQFELEPEQGLKVLIVENNKIDSGLLVKMVEGITSPVDVIVVSETLADCLKQLDEKDFDIVLLDLNLEDSVGVATIHKIKEKRPFLPVVIISGMEGDEIENDIVDSGAQDYLHKGRFNLKDLNKTVRFSIGRMRTEEKLKEVNTKLIQSEKMASVGQLAAGVAHELNSPLASIITNLHMIAENPTHEDNAQLIDITQKSAKKCRDIVTSLLKYSRGSNTVDARVLDINDVIEEACSFIGYQLEHADITLEKKLQVVDDVKVNPEEIQQVVMNLLLNARDAIKELKEQGKIAIKTEQGNKTVIITIKDDGAGIDRENLKKVFDPFYSTKDVNKGTGLGLFTTYNIVRSFDGHIEVDSEKGKGTTFTIMFPSHK
jgi:signal transduction histidine kinase